MKKFSSLVLSAVMILGLIPVTATAETQAAADIVVYMTISNKGLLSAANDNTVMANREVTVTDINDDGFFTFHEALIAAHTTYNTEDGYSIPSGAVKKLWGIETSNCLFFINNVGLSMGVKVDTVNDGDKLVASINKDDAPYYADWYTFFDSTEKNVAVNEEFTLKLMGHYGMAYTSEDMNDTYITGVSVGTWENGGFVQKDDKVTNEDGSVTLSFDKPGTYYVTADGTVSKEVTNWSEFKTEMYDCPIIAPFCKVIVFEPKELTIMKNIAQKYSETGVTDDENMLWLLADFASYETLYNQEVLTEAQKQDALDKLIDDVSNTDKPAEFAKAIIALRAFGYDARKVYTKEGTELDIVKKLTDLVEAEDAGVKNVFTLPWVLVALQQNTDYATSQQLEFLINTAVSQKDVWTELGPDGAAFMFSALAPYYDTNDNVKTAIDEAVLKVKNDQSDTGAISSWGEDNAATTGITIAGFCAIGINPEDVKKNENSLIDGLMTLATDDLTAFIPPSNSFATEQGFRGLVAYEAFKNGLRLFDFSSNPLNEAHATLELYENEETEENIQEEEKHSGGGGSSIKYAPVIAVPSLSVQEDKTEQVEFSDVKTNAWYYDAVKYVTKNGLMNGTDKGFEPDTCMSRAMLVTVLYRMNKETINSENGFKDVPIDAWYYDAVLWAKENGIVNGVSELYFAPDNNVTREQMVSIIFRYASLKGLNIEKRAELSQFYDEKEISDFAYDAFSWAKESGLVSGTTSDSISPKGTATRAQFATILMKFSEAF